MRLFTCCTVLLTLIQVFSPGDCRCGTIYGNTVSASERQQIVNAHNYYRGLISKGQVPGQPRGVNLKTIKYDAKLANAAQRISNSCKFAHQSVSDGRWRHVGQNLFIYMSTANGKGADWPSAIKAWYDEYKYYKYPNNPNSQTGHYTQLVWADTEFVGCGYTHYEDPDEKVYKYKKLYTCNYGPGGNILGNAPYKRA